MKFTVIKSKTNISKSFLINEKGELEKKDGGNLHTGSFGTTDMDVKQLADFIYNCSPKEILIQGTTDFQKGLITTKGSLKKYENASHPTVSRSKEFFSYKKEEGFLLLDYDPNEFYNDGKSLSKEEFLEKIYDTVPEIKHCPHIWKTSSSSNIIKIKNKAGNKVYEVMNGLKGQHLLVHVKDMSVIPEFFTYMYKKLWVNGEGYVFVDKVGRLHDRSVVDKVVNSPEREIFLKAFLSDDLAQNLEVEAFNVEAKALDLEKLLDIDEEFIEDIEEKFEILYKKEMAKFKKESEKKLNAYLKKNAEKHSMSEESLKHSIIERKLFSDFKIKLHDNTYVSVDTILEKPDLYSGVYCYEPFEPEYGGFCNTKAWIDAHGERIFSHAHGGIEYELVDFKKKSPDQLAHYLLGITNEKKRYKEAGELTVKYKYELTEIDLLLRKIADSTGQKIGSVTKTFEKYNKKFRQTDNTESIISLNFDLSREDVNRYDVPLDMQFPHTDVKGRVSSTSANLRFMLRKYDIKYSYNAITKTAYINIPRTKEEQDTNLTEEANFLSVQSMCVVNGMTKDTVNYMPELLNSKVQSPVMDYIQDIEWDGKDRIQAFVDRIGYKFKLFEDEVSNVNFGKKYMSKMIKMWLIQCIASLDGAKQSPIKNCVPSFEYVLVFVGGQGIRKTKFITSLLPFQFRDHIVTGHELDTKNKDSVKKAISCWICELGELDSTFKKSEISSLKAFLSDEYDIIRLPYAKTELRMKRNTTFCASVNNSDFLKDKTGNRRYLPVPVTELYPLYEKFKGYVKDIIEDTEEDGKKKVISRKVEHEEANTQQLWAQVAGLYLGGEQWWPDTELEKMLAKVTENHSQVSFVSEGVSEYIDIDKNDEWREKHKIYSDNSKYIKKMEGQVLENVRTGEGYENGSVDKGGKSTTLFYGMNVKEIFHLIGLEYNRMNMREFNEEMDKYGFTYSKKTINGIKKTCFWVSLKKKAAVLQMVEKK